MPNQTPKVTSMTTISRLIVSKKGRSVFQEAVLNPVPRGSVSMLFTPAAPGAVNPTVIGHAYDMWFRCWLGRHVESVTVDPRAFIGYKHSATMSCLDDEAAIERAFMLLAQDGVLDDPQADPLAKSAAEAIDAWIAGDGDDCSVLRACLTLGFFEIAYRDGCAQHPMKISEAEIDELRRLTEVTDGDWLKQARTVVLNPVFSLAQGLSRIAADGDLLVDSELIDLKTNRRRKLMDDWRQLAGYVALNDLQDEPLPIKRVATYYVRFGRRWSYPVDAVFAPGGRERLQHLMREELICQHQRRAQARDLKQTRPHQRSSSKTNRPSRRKS